MYIGFLAGKCYKENSTVPSADDEGEEVPCIPLRKRKSTCVDGQTSRRTFPELENNESTIGTVVPNEGLYTCSVCGKPYTYEGCMKTHEANCVQTAPWISTKSPKKKAHIDS